jgi:hypothetical protein
VKPQQPVSRQQTMFWSKLLWLKSKRYGLSAKEGANSGSRDDSKVARKLGDEATRHLCETSLLERFFCLYQAY